MLVSIESDSHWAREPTKESAILKKSSLSRRRRSEYLMCEDAHGAHLVVVGTDTLTSSCQSGAPAK